LTLKTRQQTFKLTKAPLLAICVLTATGTTTFLSSMTVAGTTEQANLSYGVYIGASKMFNIGYQTTLTDKSYHSYMKLKPKGLAKLFANITMVMNTQGVVQKHKLQPTKFSLHWKKKKRKRTSNIIWSLPDKPTTSRTYKVSSSKQAALKQAVSPKMPDPLSAFLRMGITDTKTPCGKSQRIYDGVKVYDLKFSLLAKTIYDSKAKNTYKGPAFKCRLNHKPVAGYSKNHLAKLKKDPINFTVWFAPVKSIILKKSILLPIAATGKIKGYAFSAIANKPTFAGKSL